MVLRLVPFGSDPGGASTVGSFVGTTALLPLRPGLQQRPVWVTRSCPSASSCPRQGLVFWADLSLAATGEGAFPSSPVMLDPSRELMQASATAHTHRCIS